MKDHQLHYTNQTDGRKYTRRKNCKKKKGQSTGSTHAYESRRKHQITEGMRCRAKKKEQEEKEDRLPGHIEDIIELDPWRIHRVHAQPIRPESLISTVRECAWVEAHSSSQSSAYTCTSTRGPLPPAASHRSPTCLPITARDRAWRRCSCRAGERSTTMGASRRTDTVVPVGQRASAARTTNPGTECANHLLGIHEPGARSRRARLPMCGLHH